MFKIGDVVEMTAEAAATGMLDFKDGKGYKVEMVQYNFNGDFKGHVERHQEILLRGEGGHTDWYHYTHFKLKENIIVEKKECLFKEGQVVWDVVYGKGVVVDIVKDDTYPVTVKFDREAVVMAFTEDGKTYETHGRTLFFSEPKIEAATEPLFEPTLKKGDVVVAVDKDGCSEILYVREELERQVKNTQGTLFYKEAFDFYHLGEKINFK